MEGHQLMSALLFAALGGLVGFGLLLLIGGIRGRQLVPRLADHLPEGTTREGMLLRLVGGLVAGVFVYLLTGWPVAGLATAVLAVIIPGLYGGKRRQEMFIERTQAIASWTEMIRDNLAGAAGLEQALLATAPLAPGPIQYEVERLEARLERQVPLVDSLALLGDELDHPSADLVVVAIAKASKMEVRDLNPLLSRLAQSIREDVRMRLRVEVSRARIRQSSRIVIGFTVAFVAFLFVFARDLLRPYDTVGGQIWLCVVIGVFAIAGLLIHNYSKLERPVRFALRRVPVDAGQAEL